LGIEARDLGFIAAEYIPRLLGHHPGSYASLESAVSEIRSLAWALASGANQGLVFLVIVGRFLLG
jgi:hypothetical protein